MERPAAPSEGAEDEVAAKGPCSLIGLALVGCESVLAPTAVAAAEVNDHAGPWSARRQGSGSSPSTKESTNSRPGPVTMMSEARMS